MSSNPIDDEERDSLLIQQELAKALRMSVRSVIREPLPQRMIILLLRLAFAQTLRATFGRSRRERPDCRVGDRSDQA